MKKLINLLFLSLTSLSLANEIKVSPIKDLSFQKVAISEINKDKIRAKGYIEIRLEEPLKSREEYITRLLLIKYQKKIYLSNGSNNLLVKDINLDVYKGDSKILKEAEINSKGLQVEFNGSPIKLEVTGIIDRNQINSQAEDVEGEYKGNLPLEIKQYKRK